jgi:hypothetical protein
VDRRWASASVDSMLKSCERIEGFILEMIKKCNSTSFDGLTLLTLTDPISGASPAGLAK